MTLQVLALAFSRLSSVVPSRAKGLASSIAWESSPEDECGNAKEPSYRDGARPDTLHWLQTHDYSGSGNCLICKSIAFSRACWVKAWRTVGPGIASRNLA